MPRDKSNYKKPTYRFAQHKADARVRGIPFLFTFEEWWHIWETSGHWSDRGRKKGQYCMARYNDEGPYAVGNVKIIPFGENLREALIGNQHTKGFKHSEKFRIDQSVRMMGTKRCVGFKHSEEFKADKRRRMMGNRFAAKHP